MRLKRAISLGGSCVVIAMFGIVLTAPEDSGHEFQQPSDFSTAPIELEPLGLTHAHIAELRALTAKLMTVIANAEKDLER